MNCPLCKKPLNVRAGKPPYISEEGTTDVFAVQEFMCTNRKCANFCDNLNEPKVIVDTKKTKV